VKDTYVAVATNVSILLAFAKIDSAKENAAVNAMRAPSLARSLVMKWSTRIAAVGRSDETKVLNPLAAATSVELEYSYKPASISMGVLQLTLQLAS